MRRLHRSVIFGTLALTIGCGATAPFHPATPTQVAAGAPLGASYVLVPLPHDDDALLGRVLLDVPDSERSLVEVSRPNECADKLTAKTEAPLASTFEDAQELAAGGKARAALGAFGFDSDSLSATYFYYKLDASKRVSQLDTPEYTVCCKDKGTCGYGFVSALLYGDGQYATATESGAADGISIPVAGGEGDFVTAKILHRRNVHGYVAALVTVTDPKAGRSISVLGDPAATAITLTEQNLPGPMKERFALEKIQTVARGPGPVGVAYVFTDGHGDITENEFVRRYRGLTNSHELDDAARQRWKGLLDAGILVALASVMVGGGVLTADDCLQNCASRNSGATLLDTTALSFARRLGNRTSGRVSHRARTNRRASTSGP
jgi:hypothetical protein